MNDDILRTNKLIYKSRAMRKKLMNKTIFKDIWFLIFKHFHFLVDKKV